MFLEHLWMCKYLLETDLTEHFLEQILYLKTQVISQFCIFLYDVCLIPWKLTVQFKIFKTQIITLLQQVSSKRNETENRTEYLSPFPCRGFLYHHSYWISWKSSHNSLRQRVLIHLKFWFPYPEWPLLPSSINDHLVYRLTLLSRNHGNSSRKPLAKNTKTSALLRLII